MGLKIFSRENTTRNRETAAILLARCTKMRLSKVALLRTKSLPNCIGAIVVLLRLEPLVICSCDRLRDYR